MATKTFKVSLSLDNPRIIQSGIDVRSFDKQSVKISISLTKDSQTYQIPTGATIRISLLKLARQEQKIIVDVPNTNRESIDWIVPDYLDGYQGTVRVGVYLVSGTENVDLGYFTILSNVSDIDKMADEFVDNVFQGWEQIEADLNELKLTIAQTKLDLADDLTQIDNTIANINTLASDFTTDVATKQADVTSKYNAFDTSVTTANQTIDDILALQPQLADIENVKLPAKVDKSHELGEQHIIKTLPNKVKDKLTQTTFIKNVETYTITESDVAQLVTTLPNLDIVQITKKSNDILKNQTIRTNYAFKFDGFETFNAVTASDPSNIGKVYNMTADYYGLCVSKGTYTSLASAKIGLTGLSVSYQLTTPQNIVLPTILTPNTKEIARLSEENERKANKIQEAWITPTLLNGWDNYSSAYSQCGYFKDQFGIVHLRGFIRSGVIAQNIFTLPSGYRPSALSYFSTISNNAAGVVTIGVAGDTKCIVGNNAWVTLDGITFKGV